MAGTSYADRLLQEYGITAPQEIDLDAIAFDKGALIKYRRLDGCEARIIGKENRAIISVDPRPIATRQRFSAAHELAHWLLDRGNISFLCKKSDIGPQKTEGNGAEARANGLAAQLLMPDYLFRPRANKRPLTLDTVADLAKQFRTSHTSTAIRLTQVGSYPGMVVCFSTSKREWFFRGPDVPDVFWPVRELDADSQAFELLYGEDKKTRPLKVGAETWIDRYDAHEYTITEHSMKVSSDSVLTLLWWQDEKQINNLEVRG